jgi:hypothetical protein
MTPMAAAAIAVGMGRSADAVEACPPLASATIRPPTGTVIAGSTVHVSAQINGLMLLQAHLQISGPGLDQQVGKSVMSGPISGDVTVPKAGYFTLAVIGNGTQCTYQTAGFPVTEQAAASKPTHSSAPGQSPRPGGGGHGSAGGSGASLPSGSVGGGSSAGGNNFALNPLNGASPFSLPSVAPDGAGQGFEYPTPDPQIASPPSRPVARNVAQTTPLKWGQSLAIALVLLVISAHLGMWSRRQRLAAEGARSTNGGNGKWGARKKARESARTMAATGMLQAGTATESTAADDLAATNDLDVADDTTGADPTSGANDLRRMNQPTTASDPIAMNDGSGAHHATAADDVQSTGARSKRSGGRGYRGRRRRG